MGTFARVVHCVLQGQPPVQLLQSQQPAFIMVGSLATCRVFSEICGGSQYSSVSKSLAVAISTPGLKVSVTGKKD